MSQFVEQPRLTPELPLSRREPARRPLQRGSAVARLRTRLATAPWLTLALGTLVALAVLVSPVYLVIRASEQGAGVWDGLSSARTLNALWRTVLLATTVTGTCVAVAVPLAWLTVRTDLSLRGFWTVALALPLAIPSFVGGLVTVSALGPGGMLQDVLSPLGVEQLPSLYGFWGAWLTLSALSYPYVFLQVRASLRRADPSFEEAARTLGKSGLETFLRVTLPQLRPAIAAGSILIGLYVVSEFGAVAMLRYDTLTPLVYIEYTTSFNRSSATVLALPLLGLATGAMLLDTITRGRARYHGTAVPRPAATVKLGRWRWPAVLLCAAVAVLGVGMPIAVLLYWLVKGLAQGETADFLMEAVVNSAQISLFTALLALAASLPIAVLSVRYTGWFSGLLEKIAYSGHALPGITIALSLVFFAANYLNPLYQTLGLLVFACAVRFLPEALGACRAAMLQVHPHTEEVARGLGAGKLRVFLRVTLPQIVTGMSAGGLLVFLTAMKELQITLLLSPIGYDTLATQIWAATSEAFFTRAALPSLLLVLLSATAVLFLLRQERVRS